MLTTDELIATVQGIRPEWNPEGIRNSVGKVRHAHPDIDMITVAAVAVGTAMDPASRTPGAMIRHPYLTGGGLAVDYADDQERFVPVGSGVCAHGVSVGLLTKNGRPRCPFCRRITRAERNGKTPNFRPGPSVLVGHEPEPSKDGRDARIRTEDDPELLGDIMARRFAGRSVADITFTGAYCWRHPSLPVVAPYDECDGCLDERQRTNEWREATGRPLQPPHVQPTVYDGALPYRD